ncbi:FBP domain-containing protein [Streptomyces sp. WAC06614]|uniref:FBP domain-containing protein n=1 Tax=Streptomyces sp. WAC06614 TaxID=2487416 RepID=UPI000F7A7001|nr:FBP domain-containing protein [Streptomyces sp. WAC06614]RSS60695.1 FBP domain-containing protein [Streptomyces sp. WAC06614]
MKSLTEKELRGSFVNCSKGEAARLPVPRDLESQPWADLDFLGWRDLSAPDRSYLVAEIDGVPTGIALRYPTARRSLLHRSICGLCLTVHAGSGVSLMTARKRGKEGREGSSAGLYMCTDLACSLYVRGLKQPEGGGGRFEETLTMDEQIERLRTNLAKFVASL